jgi:tetratricopeptide (TPR) repeat protein
MPEAAALGEIMEAETEFAAATEDKARLMPHIRAGFHLIPLDREAEAVVHLEAALAICRALGDHAHEIEVLLHLATALQYLGEREAARSLFNEGIGLAAQTGIGGQVHFRLHHRGRCEVEMERFPEARQSFEAALKLREKLGDERMMESSRAALEEIGRL